MRYAVVAPAEPDKMEYQLLSGICEYKFSTYSKYVYVGNPRMRHAVVTSDPLHTGHEPVRTDHPPNSSDSVTVN
jgi:hypothetical protein